MKKLLLLLLVIANSSYAQSDITEMVSDLSKLRLDTEATLTATPYRAKEHQTIKDYFVSMKEFAIQMRDNSRTNRRFNNYLASQDMAKFCSETLINVNDWNQIKTNCTRNRFFLCTEDVNEYPDSKKVLSETLSTELLQIFKTTPECQ